MNTLLKTSQQENKLSEEFFQNIFLQAGDGIFLISERGIMIEMNPRGCEILGYSREELQGQHVLKFQPVDEIDHMAKKLALLVTEKLITTESVFLRKDGSRVPVEITGKLLSNNQIIGLLRDITERKLAEQALVDSEQKYRSLVENSPDGIVVVDETGHIVEWNHGQEEITGLKRSDAIGKPAWDIQYQVSPDEVRANIVIDNLKEKVLRVITSGHGHGINELTERTFQLPDGTRRNVEIMTYTYRTNLGYRVGSVTRDISKRKQIEMLLEYLAMHDPLTDLPNRQLFEDRLRHALDRADRDRSGTLVVMMLDLDNFKEVNDVHGHACGDQVLKIVSERLQTTLRKSDTAARMGGDEFALIHEGIADVEGIHSIAHKILQTISNPLEIEDQVFQLTASVGISVYSFNGEDVSALLRHADIAMYQAKRARNSYQFYNISKVPPFV
jgi:diguanylate cyclase (GGDEF)-like protein/PAS domain S-box-containing protein